MTRKCPRCGSNLIEQDVNTYMQDGTSRKIGDGRFCKSMKCKYEEG